MDDEALGLDAVVRICRFALNIVQILRGGWKNLHFQVAVQPAQEACFEVFLPHFSLERRLLVHVMPVTFHQ